MNNLLEKVDAETQKLNAELDRAWEIYLAILTGENESDELMPVMMRLGIDRQMLAEHAKAIVDAREARREAAMTAERQAVAEDKLAVLEKARAALKVAQEAERVASVAYEVSKGQVGQAMQSRSRVTRIEANYPYLFVPGVARPYPRQNVNPSNSQRTGPTWADEGWAAKSQ